MAETKKSPSQGPRTPAKQKAGGAGQVRVVKKTLSRTKKSGPPAAVRQSVRRNYVIQTRPNAIRKPFPYAIIFSFVAIVAVAMYVLSLRITLDGLTADISRMEREIVQSREEQNALEVRLRAKYDLTEIERIAKEEYGMVNKDTLTKKYISVSGEDQIEILDADGETPGETQAETEAESETSAPEEAAS